MSASSFAQELSTAVGVRIAKLSDALQLDTENPKHMRAISELTKSLMSYAMRELSSGRAKTIEEALEN